MKTIRIPKDSSKRWLPLFYVLPRELVEKARAYLDFPRCPYDVLRTDRYDALVNDEMFLELIWDSTAWAAFQYIEVPYEKSGYHEIPGGMLDYSGDSPLWLLCYAMLPLILKKLEENGLSLQYLANVPQGQELPWLSCRQFGNLIGGLVPEIIREQNWQPVIDEAWRNRAPEDYSLFASRVKADFQRKWRHSRMKAGAPLSIEEMSETENVSAPEQSGSQESFEEALLQQCRLTDFMTTLPERDRQILRMRIDGRSEEEIAEETGYANHGAVSKRLKRIREAYREYLRKESGDERKTS